MTRPVKTLCEAARDLTLMSDDGTEYEHNDGCQGEPECPACWVEGIRQLFIDFPDETAPVARRERVAELLTEHEIVWRGEEIGDRTPQCACGWMPDSWESDDEFIEYYREHLADAPFEAGVFRDEATVKTEALREAAQAQRQLAADSKTGNCKAEHEDRADWLDDQANAIDPRRLEGAHP